MLNMSNKRKYSQDHPNPVDCDLCGKQFGRNFTLKTHLESVHQISRTHKCHLCNRSRLYFSDQVLDAHIERIHGKPESCVLCDKTFSTKGYLESHVKVIHEGIKPFACNSCDKSFGLLENLTRHIRSIHERIKNFQCEICERKFARREELNNHLKFVHEKFKDPQQCFICKKSFRHPKSLQGHSYSCIRKQK